MGRMYLPECDWLEAMRVRRSVRAYRDDPVPEALLERLYRGIAETIPLRAEVNASIACVPYRAISNRLAVGAILPVRPAPYYLIMHAPPHQFRMEEVGFRGEQVILRATALGLGTCWVGAFKPSEAVARLIGADVTDIIAVSPVGWPAEGMVARASYSLVESFAVRRGARKPLEEIAFQERWGRPVELRRLPPEISRALEMARIAPSWSNVQPWCFVVSDADILVFADSRPRRGNAQLGKPYYRLDAGIATAHIYLALCAQGISCTCQPLGLLPSEKAEAIAAPEYVVPIAQLSLA